MNTIEVSKVSKEFKLYYDKSQSLKEKILFVNRNRYENRIVLNDISFTIREGESVGLIGENGCGKSTLLKLINRILYPEKGEITVNGRVSSLIELGAGFHPDMSGRENIYTNAAIFGLSRAEIDKRLDEIVWFSELEEFIDNPIRTYSTGMYMRLGFSIAINVDADILLIDEILAVGDANFQKKCFQKLLEIKARGVTIIMVSHDLESIRNICERSIWINNGIIADDGYSYHVVFHYEKYMENKMDERKKLDEEREKQHTKQIEPHFSSTINPQYNSWGTKDVIFKEVRLKNDRWQNVDVIKSDENFSIEFDLSVKEPQERYNISIGISGQDGKMIFSVNTDMDRLNITELKDNCTVQFYLYHHQLNTGEYSVHVSIGDGREKVYDCYEVIKIFQIVSELQFTGVHYISHSWEIR